MGVSSNSIIHFTKNLESLNGILTNNFKIRYCRETICSKSDIMDIIVPIVSFCDIPFSQILNHISNYGSYGIGLKKKWAEINGLNPVLYLDANSTLSENIKILFNNIVEGKKSIIDLSEMDKCSLDFMRYLKNYQGDLKRIGKKTIKNYRFSDEREWRFVADINKFQIFGSLSTTEEYFIPIAKRFLTKDIKNERLKFTPDDINYIIIKRESERDKILSTLEKVSNKYALKQVKRMASRIISTEQLKTDF